MSVFSENEFYLLHDLVLDILSKSDSFINSDKLLEDVTTSPRTYNIQHIINKFYIILFKLYAENDHILMHETNGIIETKMKPLFSKSIDEQDDNFDTMILQRKHHMNSEQYLNLFRLKVSMYEFIIDNELYDFITLRDLKGNNVFHILFMNNDLERILKIIHFDKNNLFLYKNNDGQTPIQLTTNIEIIKIVVMRNSEVIVSTVYEYEKCMLRLIENIKLLSIYIRIFFCIELLHVLVNLLYYIIS
jgi:hypothetical protein